MSEDDRSAMPGEGDATARRANESLEDLPAVSSGEGDVTGVVERRDVERASRTATSPSIEADAEDDPQSPGKTG